MKAIGTNSIRSLWGSRLPRCKSAIICALGILAAAEAEASTMLGRVRAALDTIQPFRAVFVQQAIIEGRKEIEEKGIIVFKNPAWIKCQYLEPENRVFLYEGDSYQYYEADARQLTRGRLGPDRKEFVLNLLCANDLSDEFVASERERTIFLTARGSQAPLALEVHLGRDFLPEKVIQNDDSGVQTIYLFSQYQKITGSAANDFQFAIPEDVDIIEAD